MRRLFLMLAGALLLAGCAVPVPGFATAPGLAERLPIAEPSGLTISAIGAMSTLVPVGMTGGAIDVPSDKDPLQAAWWSGSPRPGGVGPSVIVGHVDGQVDGKAGQPGIFHRLRDLVTGDTVRIDRTDGSVATFAIYRVDRVPKASFPAAEVYGNTVVPELRLITCGGEWDAKAHSYRDNWVAYAKLV